MFFFVNQYRLFQNRSVRRFCRFVREVVSWRSLEPFRYLLPGRLRLPPIQVIITTKCTLRCKKCAHMINRYTEPKDIDDAINRETLRRLQEYADRLDDIIFIGGEAFCNPNLKYYIQQLSLDKCRKVEIVTNGTILPDDSELIAAMKEKRVQVTFSNYGPLSRRQAEAVKLLRDNGIACLVYSSENIWYDFDGTSFPNRPQKEVDSQYARCSCTIMFNVMNGIIELCPRSTHKRMLGIESVPGDEYVDILALEKKEFIRRIRKLWRRDKALTACRYCVYMTDACAVIPRAEQEEKQGA